MKKVTAVGGIIQIRKSGKRIALLAERALAGRLKDSEAQVLLSWSAHSAEDPDVVLRAVARLEARGLSEAAMRVLADAVNLNPSPALLYRYGFLLERSKRHNEARDVYSTALEQEPSAKLFFRRGRCHEALGDADAASVDFRRSLRLEAADLRVHEALYNLHKSDPMWARLEILEEGVASGVADRAWRIKLADAHFAMEHFAEAADLYRELDAEQADDRLALRRVEALYRGGQRVEARAVFEECAPRLAKQRWLKEGLGAYLQSRGLWGAAADEYAREVTASSPASHLHRCGFAHMRAYRHEQALGFLQRANATPDAIPLWTYHEGLCLEKCGRPEEAAACYVAAYMKSKSAYHLYRAVYVSRGTSWQDAVAQLLARTLKAKYAVGKAKRKPLDDLAVRLLDLALTRHARHDVQREALAALKGGDLEQAEQLLTWLCDSEQELVPADHEALAAALMEQGRVDEGFIAYLSSRAFWGPHGLDASTAQGRPNERHMHFLELQRELPVKDDVVLYESNHGGKVTCNVLPLLRANLDTERGRQQWHVVVLNDPHSRPRWLDDYHNVTIVARDSHAYLRHLATAGWLINNNTFPPYFARREGQRYLNTWHGTPVKSLGRDIRSGTMDHRNAARNFLHATHIIAPNVHTARVLIDRYDISGLYRGKLALTGYPRIDATLEQDPERLRALKARLHLTGRIVLYAPTWRGSLKERGFDVERLVSDLRVLSSLAATVIFQPHPLIEPFLQGVELPVATVPKDVDSNELLGIVDVLVTDYSSIFYDFYPLNRPVFFYAYDEEEYFADRGAYYQLEDLPGRVCRSVEALKAGIQSVLQEGSACLQASNVAVEEFCPREDGHATERALAFFFHDDPSCEMDSSFGRPRRPEILFFAGSFIPNGITSSFLALLSALDGRAEYNLNVVLQPEPVFDNEDRREKFEYVPDGVRLFGRVGTMASTFEEGWLIDAFNMKNEFYSPEHRRIYLTAFAREFHRLFGDATFDHLVCFEGYARFWLALFAGGGGDARRHAYLHSDMWREYYQRFAYLRGVFSLYAELDSLVSVSSSVGQVNQESLTARVGVGGVRMTSARNLIDVGDIVSRSGSGDWSAIENVDSGKVFVTTGRLTREKGHDLLLEAFSQVAAIRDDCSLIIVGDGPLLEPYQAFVKSRGLSERVVLTGYMENPLGVVAHADCFVFPSRYEGQGLSLVEALVLGVPSIGCDVVGVRSVLEGGFGMLAPPSVEGLRDAMLSFLEGEPMGTSKFDPLIYQEQAMSEFIEVLEG